MFSPHPLLAGWYALRLAEAMGVFFLRPSSTDDGYFLPPRWSDMLCLLPRWFLEKKSRSCQKMGWTWNMEHGTWILQGQMISKHMMHAYWHINSPIQREAKKGHLKSHEDYNSQPKNVHVSGSRLYLTRIAIPKCWMNGIFTYMETPETTQFCR